MRTSSEKNISSSIDQVQVSISAIIDQCKYRSVQVSISASIDQMQVSIKCKYRSNASIDQVSSIDQVQVSIKCQGRKGNLCCCI
jgi:hypothetical protein